jgi:hypothetical protein
MRAPVLGYASVLLALLASPLRAEDADRAIVTLSSGERVEGRFSLTDGKKLEVFDARLARRVAIDPAEIARVSASIESEKVEQGWMWREESDHEKIRLPFHYPLRKIQTEVTLVSGEVVRGHATCVFYMAVEGTDDPRRLFLLADQKGEKDQRLEDLLYVKEVVFPGRAVATASLVTIQAPEPAAAFALERDASFASPLSGLLSGRYDVFLFPRELKGKGEKSRVRYGLTGTPLEKETLARVEAKVASIEEFFRQKRVVAAAREGTTVRALLELVMTDETTDDAKWGYVRWEVWTFDATTPELDVKKRVFLHRRRFAKAQGAPAFDYVAEEKLRSVKESQVIE